MTADLADRFFAAVSAGDLQALDRLYADDVAVWHNYDEVEQTKAESLRLLGFLHRTVGPLRYVEVRRTDLADGFVQQHVVELDDLDGGVLRMPAMMRVYCDGGQVRRVEEYVEPGPVNALLRARRAARG